MERREIFRTVSRCGFHISWACGVRRLLNSPSFVLVDDGCSVGKSSSCCTPESAANNVWYVNVVLTVLTTNVSTVKNERGAEYTDDFLHVE